MEHTEDILCPDCELYYLVHTKEKENGRCTACQRRYYGKVTLQEQLGRKPRRIYSY